MLYQRYIHVLERNQWSHKIIIQPPIDYLYNFVTNCPIFIRFYLLLYTGYNIDLFDLFVLKCVYYEKKINRSIWKKIYVMINLQLQRHFMPFWTFFYFERYIKHNNIFGKNNNKGVEYKKKYFNIIFDLDLILGYFFNYKINGCEILNEILRSLSSLVLYISGYTIWKLLSLS